MPSAQRPWWHPEAHADRRPLLLARNRIIAGIREWFLAQGFIEVECGALQVSPGNEAHLHALATRVCSPDGSGVTRYLHTSPEFACKKLLAAGETRIFTLAKVYRDRESSPLHAPEFTMLEWYRVGEPYETVMEDCLALLRIAADRAGSTKLVWRERACDPGAVAQRLSVTEAFERFAGFDLTKTLGGGGEPLPHIFSALAPIPVAGDDSWSDMFSRVLSECVEPRLGWPAPCLLYEYPAIEAALARRCPHDLRLAERFELYACGVELANGFGELTDPAEQRARFEEAMRVKQERYGETYPIDEELLSALALIPAASGVAMGLDRLVMLVTAAPRIEQVLWTPYR